MAQLPPKIPSIMTHQKVTNNQWVDEFLDFSSTQRGSHRRSISDSIAYLETDSSVDECRNVSTMMGNNSINWFDGTDDEQLTSMFSDDVMVMVPLRLSTSNPSTPSDQNSNNDVKLNVQHEHQNQDHWLQQKPKHEPGEVESLCQSGSKPLPSYAATTTTVDSAPTNTDDIFKDPKRIKRILANRQSAQRSRVRKLQYISELERSVNYLQSEVSTLSPRVAFLDHQRLILNVDNSALKQQIAALAQDKIFKDAHQVALKKEIERLMQVYHQQSLEKMSSAPNSPTPPPQQPSSSDMDFGNKEQLLN